MTFNSINWSLILENISRLCRIVYMYAYNCYSPHAGLFIVGGKELKPKEGTTQGDPMLMALYGIGLIPLLSKIKSDDISEHVKHVVFADIPLVRQDSDSECSQHISRGKTGHRHKRSVGH